MWYLYLCTQGAGVWYRFILQVHTHTTYVTITMYTRTTGMCLKITTQIVWYKYKVPSTK